MESSYIVAGIIANEFIAIARSYIGIKVRLQVRIMDEERAIKILEPSVDKRGKRDG